MAASKTGLLSKPPATTTTVGVKLIPPTPPAQPTTEPTSILKKKKKKPLIVNRPPAIKPTVKSRRTGPNGKNGGKKALNNNDGFPIPLAYLYRDPRPNRRTGGGAGGGGGSGSGAIDYGSGGASGDNWGETDGDGLPMKETAEQVREKKTLYAANMAQAQAFQNNYRFQDAQNALTKVRSLSFSLIVMI